MCARASAGIGGSGRRELSTLCPWDRIASFLVHSDLVVDFNTCLHKFVKYIWQGDLVREGLFKFPIQALLEERDLGTFINSQDCCLGHEGGMVGGAITLLPKGTDLGVCSLIGIGVIEGSTESSNKFGPSRERYSAGGFINMWLKPLLSRSCKEGSGVCHFSIVCIGSCVSVWV